VCTSIRQPVEGRRHRFSWINEWQERTDHRGRPFGLELILPDWFYRAVLDDAFVLTIDRAYFALTSGLERWLYRLVRKHGGRQRGGWCFEVRHLHVKSGGLSSYKRFAFELRNIVRRQPLPGYTLFLAHDGRGQSLLSFEPTTPCGKAVDGGVLSGTRIHVPSGTDLTCYRVPKQDVTHGRHRENRALNLESNVESNFCCARGDVEKPIDDGGKSLDLSSRKGANARTCRRRGSTSDDALQARQCPRCGQSGATR